MSIERIIEGQLISCFAYWNLDNKENDEFNKKNFIKDMVNCTTKKLKDAGYIHIDEVEIDREKVITVLNAEMVLRTDVEEDKWIKESIAKAIDKTCIKVKEGR